MSKGKLIVIEGIDGSGKDTIAERLASYLKSYGIDVLVTKEPGDAFDGKIREILLTENVDAYSELFLFLADRRRHVLKTIKPALDRGNWVIAIRFTDSSFAYQGAKGVDGELIDKLNDIATGGLNPDLVILLDIPADEAVKRLEKRGNRDRFEDKDFLARVRQRYLSLSGRDNVVVIDASVDVEEVWRRVKEAVDSLLGDVGDVPDELYHDYAVSTVAKAVDAGVHAFLLVGPWNCCERLTLKHIVKTLIPDASEDSDSPIEVSHFDLFVVAGEGPQDIKIDHIRQIEDFVDYRPVSGPKKVVVIAGVENMTNEAANALLKTLEEPPDWVVFVLFTSALHMVLPTIVSRSLVLHLHRFPTAVIRRWLVRKKGLNLETVERVLPLLEGCPTRLEYAMKMMEHEGIFDKLRNIRFHEYNKEMASLFWEDGPAWDGLLFEAVDRAGDVISTEAVFKMIEVFGGLKRRVQKKLISDVLYLLVHGEGCSSA